jgi:hypothetical protein
MHGTYKSRKSILKTIRHRDITKEVIYYYKSSMFFIFSRHWYLMKTRISIYEAQQVIARSRIHDLIYMWKRERIFGACLVETSVANAHPKFLAGLGDDNRVGQLPWVVDLPDEFGVKRLLDFFMDKALPFNRLLPGLLLHRPDIMVGLQMVLNHLPSDPRHL